MEINPEVSVKCTVAREHLIEGQPTPGSRIARWFYFCVFLCICLSDAEQSEWRLVLPQPPYPRGRRGGGAHLLRRFHKDLTAPCVSRRSAAGARSGRSSFTPAPGRGWDAGGGGGCAQSRAPCRAPEGVARAARLGRPGFAGATCGPRFVLCHCAGGVGHGAGTPRLGWGLLPGFASALRVQRMPRPPARAHHLLVFPSLAALSPLRRCWPDWGLRASGASWTCWGWRRRL